MIGCWDEVIEGGGAVSVPSTREEGDGRTGATTESTHRHRVRAAEGSECEGMAVRWVREEVPYLFHHGG